jgi:fatty-acyl-CoA synthase
MQDRSYAHGAYPVPLLGETIGDNLRRTVERCPDQEALVVRSQNYRATWRQLWDAITRAAKSLLARGIQRGDRVGVWAANCHEWVVVQYATARVGAILVNVNPAYQVPELEYALNQSGIRMLFHGRRYRENDYHAMIETVRPKCRSLETTLAFDGQWESFLAEGSGVSDAQFAARETLLQCDDAINIQYTSGTTGFPKGATLTHHNILNNAYFVGLSLGYTPEDRVCIPVPFYHCFGMVLGNLACTSLGSCMVIPGEIFQPDLVLQAVQAERCTSLYGVPTMFRMVLEVPDFSRYNVSSLRTGIMAGAPCPVELMREVITNLHMPEVAIGYGMTETSPLSTLSARDDALERRVSTIGRVQPHCEICIRDPATGAVVPRGTVGEFCTRGYSVMQGYWNDDKATRASIDGAHWMHSGDLASMDEAGYVNIVGRLKDMIARGGEKIFPREIEELLHTHQAIAEAQVVGVPSRKYGEEVMAWVRLREGSALSEEQLRSWCCERLARFKMPRFWRFVESFPMTVTGKIQKFKLREMAIEILGRQADAEEETA